MAAEMGAVGVCGQVAELHNTGLARHRCCVANLKFELTEFAFAQHTLRLAEKTQSFAAELEVRPEESV